MLSRPQDNVDQVRGIAGIAGISIELIESYRTGSIGVPIEIMISWVFSLSMLQVLRWVESEDWSSKWSNIVAV